MDTISLRPLTDGDIPLVARWLAADHVRPWFERPEAWLCEIRGRAGAYAFIRHFIAVCGQTPIGFCQYYDCYASGEACYDAAAPGEACSIDYLIGEENYLGGGYGKALVGAITERAVREASPRRILVKPDAQNVLSNLVLEKNGYVFDVEKEYYVKAFR